MRENQNENIKLIQENGIGANPPVKKEEIILKIASNFLEINKRMEGGAEITKTVEELESIVKGMSTARAGKEKQANFTWTSTTGGVITKKKLSAENVKELEKAIIEKIIKKKEISTYNLKIKGKLEEAITKIIKEDKSYIKNYTALVDQEKLIKSVLGIALGEYKNEKKIEKGKIKGYELQWKIGREYFNQLLGEKGGQISKGLAYSLLEDGVNNIESKDAKSIWGIIQEMKEREKAPDFIFIENIFYNTEPGKKYTEEYLLLNEKEEEYLLLNEKEEENPKITVNKLRIEKEELDEMKKNGLYNFSKEFMAVTEIEYCRKKNDEKLEKAISINYNKSIPPTFQGYDIFLLQGMSILLNMIITIIQNKDKSELREEKILIAKVEKFTENLSKIIGKESISACKEVLRYIKNILTIYDRSIGLIICEKLIEEGIIKEKKEINQGDKHITIYYELEIDEWQTTINRKFPLLTKTEEPTLIQVTKTNNKYIVDNKGAFDIKDKKWETETEEIDYFPHTTDEEGKIGYGWVYLKKWFKKIYKTISQKKELKTIEKIQKYEQIHTKKNMEYILKDKKQFLTNNIYEINLEMTEMFTSQLLKEMCNQEEEDTEISEAFFQEIYGINLEIFKEYPIIATEIKKWAWDFKNMGQFINKEWRKNKKSKKEKAKKFSEKMEEKIKEKYGDINYKLLDIISNRIYAKKYEIKELIYALNIYIHCSEFHIRTFFDIRGRTYQEGTILQNILKISRYFLKFKEESGLEKDNDRKEIQQKAELTEKIEKYAALGYTKSERNEFQRELKRKKERSQILADKKTIQRKDRVKYFHEYMKMVYPTWEENYQKLQNLKNTRQLSLIQVIPITLSEVLLWKKTCKIKGNLFTLYQHGYDALNIENINYYPQSTCNLDACSSGTQILTMLIKSKALAENIGLIYNEDTEFIDIYTQILKIIHFTLDITVGTKFIPEENKKATIIETEKEMVKMSSFLNLLVNNTMSLPKSFEEKEGIDYIKTYMNGENEKLDLLLLLKIEEEITWNAEGFCENISDERKEEIWEIYKILKNDKIKNYMAEIRKKGYNNDIVYKRLPIINKIERKEELYNILDNSIKNINIWMSMDDDLTTLWYHQEEFKQVKKWIYRLIKKWLEGQVFVTKLRRNVIVTTSINIMCRRIHDAYLYFLKEKMEEGNLLQFTNRKSLKHAIMLLGYGGGLKTRAAKIFKAHIDQSLSAGLYIKKEIIKPLKKYCTVLSDLTDTFTKAKYPELFIIYNSLQKVLVPAIYEKTDEDLLPFPLQIETFHGIWKYKPLKLKKYTKRIFKKTYKMRRETEDVDYSKMASSTIANMIHVFDATVLSSAVRTFRSILS